MLVHALLVLLSTSGRVTHTHSPNCVPGRYQQRAAGCAFCPGGKHQAAASAHRCNVCPVGKYQFLNGQRHCTPCAEGRAANRARTFCSCALEGPNADDDDGARRRLLGTSPESLCSPTSAPTASPTPVPTIPLPLAASAPLPLVRCPPGKYRLAAPPQLTAMMHGGNSGVVVCAACNAGLYATPTLHTPCTACARNRYAPRAAMAHCIACSPGRYQPSRGARRCAVLPALDHTACPPGKHEAMHALAGANVVYCRACTPGRYGVAWHDGRVAQQRRRDDPVGQEDLSQLAGWRRVASVACTACAAGQYQPRHGRLRCKLCARGYAQPAAGSRQCLACPRMSYQAERGGTLCLVCPDGTFQEHPGQAYCESTTTPPLQRLLPRPTAPASVAPTRAPSRAPTRAPTYAFTAAPTPAPCAAGRYRRSFSLIVGQQGCADCPAGRFACALGAQRRCLACPLGRYAARRATRCELQHTAHAAAMLRVDLAAAEAIGAQQELSEAAATVAGAICPAGRFGVSTTNVSCALGQAGNLSFTSAVLSTTTPLSGWKLVLPPAAKVLARKCCARCPRGRFRMQLSQQLAARLLRPAVQLPNNTAARPTRVVRLSKQRAAALLRNEHNGGAQLVALLGAVLGIPAAQRNDSARVAKELMLALDVRSLANHSRGDNGRARTAVGISTSPPSTLLLQAREGGAWREWRPSNDCAPCPAGRIGVPVDGSAGGTAGADTAGAAHCRACAAGKSADARRIACWACPVGTFNGLRGNPHGCVACPVGKFGTSYNPFACYDCAAGKVSAARSSACVIREGNTTRGGGNGTAESETETLAITLAQQLREAMVRRQAAATAVAEQRAEGKHKHKHKRPGGGYYRFEPTQHFNDN